MRDEVLASLIRSGERLGSMVYCHVSGGLVIGTAVGAIIFPARNYRWFNFQSTNKRFHTIEQWGCMSNYVI
jgi:hypothetical protein